MLARLPRPRRAAARFWPLLLALFPFTGCVYFNTFYNAEKAYRQALRLRDLRLEKNPEDTVLASADEKLKLERAINKSSAVLELYPDKPKYLPKALFLIGECYLFQGDYPKAITKYEELQRHYPGAAEIPTAQYHRAQCLFWNGQFAFARDALEKVAQGSPVPAYRQEALVFLARLHVKTGAPDSALEVYEHLLAQGLRGELARGNAHVEAAKLAYQLQLWERARSHARAKEVGALPLLVRYHADLLAADCLMRLGRPGEAAAELEGLLKNRLFTPNFPEIKLRLADARLAAGEDGRALELWKDIALFSPKTAFSAEAFYRLGEYQLRRRLDEKQAKVFYDSGAAAGEQFDFAKLSKQRSEALAKLSELRAKPKTPAPTAHTQDFMIAELFLFRLESMDSALARLDRILRDTVVDSAYTLRAAYARAFIEDEYKKSKPASDSLYRFVMQRFPNTEFAKQAEKNLGLKASIETREDKAHKLFLEAEAMEFGGEDLPGKVVPAFRKVVAEYPETREAAKAQYAIARLYEQDMDMAEKNRLDSAKGAYALLRNRFPASPYASIANAKLGAAGVNATGATGTGSTANRAPGAGPGEPNPNSSKYGVEGGANAGTEEPDHPKEVLEKDYNSD